MNRRSCLVGLNIACPHDQDRDHPSTEDRGIDRSATLSVPDRKLPVRLFRISLTKINAAPCPGMPGRQTSAQIWIDGDWRGI